MGIKNGKQIHINNCLAQKLINKVIRGEFRGARRAILKNFKDVIRDNLQFENP